MESQVRESSGIAFEDNTSEVAYFKASVPALTPDSADTTREGLATRVVNRITEGRIFPDDRKAIASIVKEAYSRREHRQLQQEVNELLSTCESRFRLLLDDSLVNGNQAGMILLYVIEKKTGSITSGMSTVISAKQEFPIVPSPVAHAHTFR
jgi:hypothetical protein